MNNTTVATAKSGFTFVRRRAAAGVGAAVGNGERAGGTVVGVVGRDDGVTTGVAGRSMLGRCGAGAELGVVDGGVDVDGAVAGGVGVEGGGVVVGVDGVAGAEPAEGVDVVDGVDAVLGACGGVVGADGGGVTGVVGAEEAGGVDAGGVAGRDPPFGAVVAWPSGWAQFEHQRASARFAVPQDGQRTGRSSDVGAAGRFGSLGSLIGRG